ncbi:zinc finger CCCH domain-containing protein 11A isoform X2 [Arapaima gigas]
MQNLSRYKKLVCLPKFWKSSTIFDSFRPFNTLLAVASREYAACRGQPPTVPAVLVRLHLGLFRTRAGAILDSLREPKEDQESELRPVYSWKTDCLTLVLSNSVPRMETPLRSACRKQGFGQLHQRHFSGPAEDLRERILPFHLELKKAVACTIVSMTNHGNDCYFYYYSTCTKGDSCPFRHCEAAMGSEIVCNLWQENRCFRKICKFRHMEIKKKRGEIPCYWENQPAGCQKPHCAFHHEKPRFIDGVYVPPSKVPILKKEVEEETHQMEPPPPAPAAVTNPPNPQLRGVIKAETLENVPSPTHPPVVISTVDDEDEDEDDQFSEEGEEGKVGSDATRIVSPRKLIPGTNQDDSLNFGIRTLEEIRLRKALKANLKKMGQSSSQACNNSTSVEKENIRSLSEASFLTVKEETQMLPEEPVKRRITERLGKRKVSLTREQQVISMKDPPVIFELPLKHRLAERLGKKVTHPEEDAETPQALKPVRERLGLPAEPAASETENVGDAKSSGEIRIKTLEEIKQEKAVRSQGQVKEGSSEAAATKVPSSTKRASKAVPSPPLRTFSEVLHAKKKQEEQKAVREPEAANSEKSKTVTDTKIQEKVPTQPGEVRVKTLEEIRREKAARIQAKAEEVRSEKSPSTGDGLPKKRILRISKAVPSGALSVSGKKNPEVKERSMDPANTEVRMFLISVVSAANEENRIKVKTFEEIMREKRLRMQQQGQEVSAAQPDEPCSNTTTKAALAPQKERSLNIIRQRGGKVPPSGALQQKNGSPSADAVQTETLPSFVEKAEADSPSTIPGDSCSSLKQKVCVVPSPVSQTASILTPEEPQDAVFKKSPGHVAEPKVRPKLNVKPSVMKPAAPVKLGQKRKILETHQSAVAEVKPLNSAPSAVEDQSKKQLRKQTGMAAPSENPDRDMQESSWAPTPPVLELLEDLGSIEMVPESCLSTHPQGVSFAGQSRVTHSPAASASRESHTAPQSSVISPKPPSQGKARRLSSVLARASGATVDDFDDLINEFADDRIEDDMELDTSKGGDDLLLELTEMIGN